MSLASRSAIVTGGGSDIGASLTTALVAVVPLGCRFLKSEVALVLGA
jgi:NAD(P)-dependent dehydrogenase (short-subunit alcohol dehydrogenase family)